VKAFRYWRTAMAAVVALGCAAVMLDAPAAPAAAATAPRVDLGVLVVSDGSPWVDGIQQQLSSEGVPTKVVDLNSASRPAITSSFLAGTVSGTTTPEARYQGVVLPNDTPAGLSVDELSALASYETTYSVRQVDAYTYPTPNLGLNYPTYAGSLDAAGVTVTSAAKSTGFGYLNGTFAFAGTAGGASSYGYLATPADGATFTPYLTATTADGSATGAIAGVYTTGKRQQMELSFGYSYNQLQYRYVAHGIVDWITRGVHFGYWRNWFDVHFDDVFNYDAIWSTQGDCTPGDGTCPAGTPDTTPVRMTAADVQYLKSWQPQYGFTVNLVFNGGASKAYIADNNLKSDPLLTAFKNAGVNNFVWINHTYTHEFLGCQQDFTVVPWQCQKDANGNILWVSTSDINAQIANNVKWASTNGIPINKAELVSGEHSGTLILPQQPVDNPNFVKAMGTNGITVTGLDASREPALRSIGTAMGFPRHPINVFYNVSTEAEEISEYNWIYTSKADGGSGICENNPTSTCIAPLGANGWDDYILPQATSITLSSVLSNDPRTYYMHQSNLVDDHLGIQVMSSLLTAYRSVYASSAPVSSVTFSAGATYLSRQQSWATALGAGTVKGYVQGAKVTLTGPSGTMAPFTAPEKTEKGADTFGVAYAGERSNWLKLASSATTLTLPSTPYPA
jgi:hypothetical protein